MYLKDLINGLQELYETYTDEWKQVAGEPEITIDKYIKINTKTYNHIYEHKGIVPDIQIKRSVDGSFLILSAAIIDRKKSKKVTKGKKREL